MQINLMTIEQHAGEKLRRIERAETASERLEGLRKFLKIESERLRLRHRFGLGGMEIVRARSLIVDLLISSSAEAASSEGQAGGGEKELSIIALGGYGRSELAPHSDIDLLFLYRGRKESGAAQALSEAILYLLWDVGFTVGHSLRSMRECLRIAREDAVSRTALLDARLIWGNSELFAGLREKLDEEVYRPRRAALIDEIVEGRGARYSRFGEAVCLQEPNLKEAAGGLRDLQTMLWALRIAHGPATLTDLAAAGLISRSEAKALAADYDFLLRVRNALHFITNRRTDLLSFDLQGQVARDLGYRESERMQDSEIFMRDYYLHARRLHRLSQLHLQRLTARPARSRWFARARQTATAGGFVMRDGELDLAPDAPPLDATRLLVAFSYSQATGASFSGALQEAAQRNLALIDRRFRASGEAARAFLKVLGTRGRASLALRQMHELGFLGKYLPEFGRITCLVQHDLYHRYTIDEHTLRAIAALDELHNSRSRQSERYREVYAEVADPSILHLGLLLHDIGKGLGGGHTEKGVAIAERICARLGMNEKATGDVLFLIRHHLLMSHISQRRDLSDEKVIKDFSSEVGTVDRLRMLLLLTYGDTNGVGPGVWNEWKDALLWELYLKARAALSGGESEAGASERLEQRIAQMLSSEVDIDAVREHFRLLPESYARQTPPQVMIEHIRLANALNSRPVRLSWRVNAQARCTDLHLCARNRSGLFAAIAGTLSAQGVNILSVQLNTRLDGLAVDSLKVRDTAGEPISDPQRWEQIENEIRRALSGELDVAEAVARRLRAGGTRLARRARASNVTTRITWDNESSDRSTILEVRASDRLGLAYRIASTLAARGLDINFAKVATEKSLALDIFYITDANGAKLDDSQLPAIEEEIRAALGSGGS